MLELHVALSETFFRGNSDWAEVNFIGMRMNSNKNVTAYHVWDFTGAVHILFVFLRFLSLRSSHFSTTELWYKRLTASD